MTIAVGGARRRNRRERERDREREKEKERDLYLSTVCLTSPLFGRPDVLPDALSAARVCSSFSSRHSPCPQARGSYPPAIYQTNAGLLEAQCLVGPGVNRSRFYYPVLKLRPTPARTPAIAPYKIDHALETVFAPEISIPMTQCVGRYVRG
ncbi:hypothetical protein PMIN01_10279 [Paraphaeosphaeria minitans]|uniref:Uncharacterized protein n=1 Tax=Paraphaeosphaeria minitans TaxID=565426 RepID=A0A9P6G991_9PLEO|nr:hypothetical protein PMIN01_10279 [Paraphaeosphaeria minitans]